MIKGEAITAGSAPTFFARRGMNAPTIFEQKTVRTRVREITAETMGVISGFPRMNPSKRRTKEEACKYMRDLRTYKKKLIKKSGDSDA